MKKLISSRWAAPFGLVLSLVLIPGSSLRQADAWDAVGNRNVLMIVVDDLNDWISLLDANAPIKTPNLERLASRGMLFTRAYCVSPACNPSRVATLTGLRPSSTGVYGNKSDWRTALPKRRTIMQQFMASGYQVRGAGKIFHHHLDGAFHDDDSFHAFQPMAKQRYPQEKLNGAPEYGSRNTDWGAFPNSEEESIDYQSVSYVVNQLRDPKLGDSKLGDSKLGAPKSGASPWFLACGIYKPHSPFFAPEKYHRLLHKRSLEPVRSAGDWQDLPSGAEKLLRSKKWFWNGMMGLEQRRPGAYQEFLRAYAACASFADAQVGRLLQALDQSPYGRNTIVVLWSDHGFHLGEKDHIEKFALWEKSTHVPFIVAAPGVTQPGSRCDRPIDLSSLYPTLLELCGLPELQPMDGPSIVKLLREPDAIWNPPAVMTYQRGNHAVRSDRWRYIRYADGSEELYDHANDRHEHTNIAQKKSSARTLAEHRKWLPQVEADVVGDLSKN